jgi:hypothetical protein
MSKVTIDFKTLQTNDTDALMQFERQLLGEISREVQERREAKRNKGKKKKKGRGRR